MSFSKRITPVQSLALVAFLGIAPAVQASTLIVDRGLPGANLNNAAGDDRSNVVWSFAGNVQSGDTFSLPPTNNPALPSWRIDKLSTWFVFGPNDAGATVEIGALFSEISLFLGSDAGVGSSIDRVANSTIINNGANASNVAITPVTYADGQDYQDRETLDSEGSFAQIWQVDFTDLGMFSAGDYAFSVAGLPLNNTSNIFNHASNDDNGGVPADGADDRFAFFSGDANASALTLIAFGNAAVPGFFEKSSDINVQVYATPVPLPAVLPLLMAALGWLGLVARRRRKVV